jgi:predicted metal-binding protein
MKEHTKVVCPACRGVITQCRCFEPDKAIVVSQALCDTCQKKRSGESSATDVGSDIPGGGAA